MDEVRADDKIFEIVQESQEKPKLVVSSFNICRSGEKEDIKDIIEAILKYNPDVLSLQGLTKKNCECIFRLMKQGGYSFSRFDQTGPLREDFEILFTKNTPVLFKEYKPFNKSFQNRGMSIYIITAGSKTQKPINFGIITSKFEEGAQGNILRKTQILEVEAEAKKRQEIPLIFAGDTSIPSWQSSDSSFRAPNGWYDAWREKGTSENEKTSLYDRTDQIWLQPAGERSVEILDFSRIRVNSSEETRAGVCATFVVN